MELKDIVSLFGLSAPFTAAGAVYGIFAFLDKKASEEANQTISSWIRGERYRRVDLGKVIESTFDHVYGPSLLSLKAFLRSIAISCLSFALCTLYSGFVIELFIYPQTIPTIILPIMMSDYISLFFVKWSLKLAKRTVPLAVGVAFASAAASILAFNFFVALGFATVFWMELSGELSWFVMASYAVTGMVEYARTDVLHSPILLWTIPALVVHLWLPLLLLGGIINGGLVAFFRTTAFAQWFISRGTDHPLEAIGMSASCCVFVASALLDVAFHLP